MNNGAYSYICQIYATCISLAYLVLCNAPKSPLDWRVTLLWHLVSFQKIYCSISRLYLCLPKDMIDVRHGEGVGLVGFELGLGCQAQ